MPQSSAKLKQRAAGYLLAAANAELREKTKKKTTKKTVKLCKAYKCDGIRCRYKAKRGSDFCGVHACFDDDSDDDYEDERVCLRSNSLLMRASREGVISIYR